MLTVEEMKEAFSSDSESGSLYWRVDCGQRGRVGKRAGGIRMAGLQRYLMVGLNGVQHPIHRIIWAIHHGRLPEGEVDHIDGDRENNGIKNLREVSHAENVKNSARRHDNKSGVSGVCWNKKKHRWIVQIGKDGAHQVGGFLDFFDACCARKSAELWLGYHANHGRSQ